MIITPLVFVYVALSRLFRLYCFFTRRLFIFNIFLLLASFRVAIFSLNLHLNRHVYYDFIKLRCLNKKKKLYYYYFLIISSFRGGFVLDVL